jgi:sulfur-carrier protein
MRIQVFAVLKDHFEKEFEVHTNVADADALRNLLIQLKPEAQNILNSCRFAVNDEFVEMNFKLKSNDTIVILPPSSGG